ncbi:MULTISPECIES: hypothetical protein [Bacillaceae]|uniref:hypothetical protein n=1 Tax=Bacillaceae TaxID=186817 RepID=UPI000E71AA3B|nr:hypothetical protein [Bacillus sp. PK3_68]RJS60176.1 hypothetical protein CJ483_08945 [Bacillus sp. PK3_68]
MAISSSYFVGAVGLEKRNCYNERRHWIEEFAVFTVKGDGIVLQSFILGMFFLYFPEDKTEYIPAVISMAIFTAAAVAVFLYFRRISKKEEEKVNKKYSEMKK